MGRSLPDSPNLSDYRHSMWIMPVVLLLGAVAALALRERAPDAPTLAPEEVPATA